MRVSLVRMGMLLKRWIQLFIIVIYLIFFSKDAHENSMPPESSDPLFGSPSEEHPIEPDEGEGADEDAEGGMANASLSSQPSGPSRFQVHLGTRLLHKCCVELNYIALCFCFFF